METIIFSRVNELKKELDFLQKKLNVKIKIDGKRVTFGGEPFEEYEANLVMEAINFGYPVRTAILLKEEDVVFRKLSLKDFTRRKDLEVIKARLIGTYGRTKRTIENLSDCRIIIKDNEIGILCSAEEIEYTITGIASLIRGSKQANVYKFLERVNAQRKKQNKK